MSTKQYLIAFNLCVVRDGYRCDECGWSPGDAPTAVQKRYKISENLQRLELDHVDGNPRNNPPDGSNWRLLCRSCNVLGGVERERERGREQDGVMGGKREGEGERARRGDGKGAEG
jgi:hypothetical protein